MDPAGTPNPTDTTMVPLALLNSENEKLRAVREDWQREEIFYRQTVAAQDDRIAFYEKQIQNLKELQQTLQRLHKYQQEQPQKLQEHQQKLQELLLQQQQKQQQQ